MPCFAEFGNHTVDHQFDDSGSTKQLCILSEKTSLRNLPSKAIKGLRRYQMVNIGRQQKRFVHVDQPDRTGQCAGVALANVTALDKIFL